MDFGWADDQTALYQHASVAARALQPVDLLHDRQNWHRLAELGFLGLSVPQACGGMGLDALTTAYVVEGVGRHSSDTGLVFSACAHLFAAAMPIAAHASPALRDRLMAPLCGGELIGANAITEGEAGSDVFALKARAERVPDGYLLNGSKSYVTNGPIADVIVVYASTRPDHGHLGISAFVVEKGHRGLVRAAPFETTGLPGSPIGSVYLNDCLVPQENRLGAEGEGAAVFQASMLWERACLFAMYLGVMERDLDSAVGYARERRQFGKTIGRYQAVSHRLVDMKLRLEAARLLLYRACWLHDRGQDAAIAVSLAKIAVSEAAVQSGLDAIRIHGGAGLMASLRLDRGLLDALPSTVFSGTSDMQREIVARRMGL
jgi:L-prolyl-PCP dehydrogenase